MATRNKPIESRGSIMEKQQIEIIKKVLMLSTKSELDIVRANLTDAICRECDNDDKERAEFKKWRAEKNEDMPF